ESHITNMSFEEFKSLLENDKKNILDYCEAKLPDKENFLNNILENNKDSDLLMYKGFVYSFLRNKNVIDEIVNELNANTKNKNFYKLVGSTFVKNPIKCNQEYKNICTSEMIKMLETEVDCNTLTTNRIYNSLFKNEYFNKLVKFNIDEINDIHAQIALRKQQIQNYCEIEFLIDDFSTNNRFENFMKVELLKISEALKHNQLFTPESSKSTNISNDAKKEFNKRQLKILGEEEVPEISDPISESSDNFNKLENKIKNIELSDILKLDDNNNIYQKIINSNLPEKDIPKLQKLRKEQLNKLIEKQYNELENIINTSKDIDELNKLKSIIKKLENNQLEKINNLKPIEKPESILFNELKEQIKNIDLSNTEKLLDSNDLHQTIINSNLPSNDIADLENLRNEKLKQLTNKQYNQFENLLNSLESEEDLENLKN
ncbi:21766_t:CDS:2, partial [Cetraspora pellucida]